MMLPSEAKIYKVDNIPDSSNRKKNKYHDSHQESKKKKNSANINGAAGVTKEVGNKNATNGNVENATKEE
jgi:hypothetical protein